MVKMTDLVENDQNGKASVSQRFVLFKSIYITKYKKKTLETSYLVMTPFESKVTVTLFCNNYFDIN